MKQIAVVRNGPLEPGKYVAMAEVKALVEAAYRKGYCDGWCDYVSSYDEGIAPSGEDASWANSRARSATNK